VIAVADDGFTVRPADLTTHADSVDAVANQVSQAQGAGSAVVMGRQAYGYICAFVPAMFDPVQKSLVEILGTSAERLHGSAGTVRLVASAYQRGDESVAGSYGETERRLNRGDRR
jgi:hypothetical protein